MQQPISMTVAFDDADAEGIVFFGNYFRLAHRALEQYLPKIGIPWATWFSHEVYGVPLRKVDCEYLSPLRPGETFHIHIQVGQMSESTVTFTYDFINNNQRVTAKLNTTHVFIDRKKVQKASIPDDIRDLLEAQKSS